MSPQDKETIVPPYAVEGYEQTGSYTNEDDADRKVFQQLLELGADLNKARHTIHYFYFETVASAEEACKDLEQMHFEVSIGARLEHEPTARQWPVIAERIEVINEETIKALRGPLSEIAENHGGEYDGWEAAAN